MADEEIRTPAEGDPQAEIEQRIPKPPSKSRSVAAVKARGDAKKAARSKSRGLTEQEKLERVRHIDENVAAGDTLKAAVEKAGISDQTYYQWKKVLGSASQLEIPEFDEFAEFVQLDEENRRLRKLLAEKLRAENADLRRRLGLK